MTTVLHRPIAATSFDLLDKLPDQTIFLSASDATKTPVEFLAKNLFLFPASDVGQYYKIEPRLDYVENPYTPYTEILIEECAKPAGESGATLFLGSSTNQQREFTRAFNAPKPGNCEILLNAKNKIAQIHVVEFFSHAEPIEPEHYASSELNGVRYEGALVFEFCGCWSLSVQCVEGAMQGFSVRFLETAKLYNFMRTLPSYRSVGNPQDRTKFIRA